MWLVPLVTGERNLQHEKGLICDPAGKTKSVILTDEEFKQSEVMFISYLKNNK